MRHYELVCIMHPDLDEAAFNGIIEKIKSGGRPDPGGLVSSIMTMVAGTNTAASVHDYDMINLLAAFSKITLKTMRDEGLLSPRQIDHAQRSGRTEASVWFQGLLSKTLNTNNGNAYTKPVLKKAGLLVGGNTLNVSSFRQTGLLKQGVLTPTSSYAGAPGPTGSTGATGSPAPVTKAQKREAAKAARAAKQSAAKAARSAKQSAAKAKREAARASKAQGRPQKSISAPGGSTGTSPGGTWSPGTTGQTGQPGYGMPSPAPVTQGPAPFSFTPSASPTSENIDALLAQAGRNDRLRQQIIASINATGSISEGYNILQRFQDAAQSDPLTVRGPVAAPAGSIVTDDLRVLTPTPGFSFPTFTPPMTQLPVLPDIPTFDPNQGAGPQFNTPQFTPSDYGGSMFSGLAGSIKKAFSLKLEFPSLKF